MFSLVLRSIARLVRIKFSYSRQLNSISISRSKNQLFYVKSHVRSSKLLYPVLTQSYHQSSHEENRNQSAIYAIAGAAIVSTGFWLVQDHLKQAQCAKRIEESKKHETVRKDLPTYSADEVSKHSDENSSVWVTFGIGVYDITKFIPEHPGAKKNIMLGAGSAIDPFWHTYQFHTEQKILDLLEKYRIGNLKAEDQQSVADQGDPYANEPKRSSLLVPKSVTPFNAEPPLSLLVENFITPVEYFYVRNHLPVPDIKAEDYELEVEIESSGKKKSFSLKDLKTKFPKTGVVAVVMCGGNRRSEMNGVKEVRGLGWGAAACGNAVYEGVRLCDFLTAMGVKSDEHSHLILEGYDTDPTSTPYAASIPLSKAMDSRGDVILAYEMNGAELTRDHGYPLRIIVPGVVGARNLKWLGKMTVSKNESDSHWQQNDYKAFSPSTDWDNVDFKTAPAIQNMPVTSAICTPNPLENQVKIVDGHLEVKGYAYSGGGNRIIRVDVTGDQGKSWITADLQQLSDGENVGPGRHYAWTLWTANVPIAKNQKSIEVWSKAVDSNYNCQPETFKNTWNLRGVVANAYNRVRVTLS